MPRRRNPSRPRWPRHQRRQRLWASAALLLLMTGWPRLAFGQASGPTDPPGTLRLGPIAATPAIVFSPFGTDSNVFYQPSNPKSDRTFTLQPSVGVLVHLGPGTFVSTTVASWTGYHTYADQSTKNIDEGGRFELPLNRVTLRASFDVASDKARPSLDIDFRARYRVSSAGLGADVQVLPKTLIRVESSTQQTTFQNGAVGLINLATALDRTSRETDLSLRHDLSPLTTVVFTAGWLSDRFALAPSRNTTGFRLMPGVEFSKFALISGSASVGYRRLEPTAPDVPSFGGLAAEVDLASVIRGVLRLSAQVVRDVGYSYDPNLPYYIQTGSTASVAYRLGERWDAQATVGVQRLAYRVRSDAAPGQLPAAAGGTATAVPRVLSYGLSVGYLMRHGLRLGVINVAQVTRTSTSLLAGYTDWQVGSSITYGY
jgi:hypothetical protein